MKEQNYFKQSGNPEISVALAGISKWDWQKVSEGDSKEAAIELMRENRFDVLPIESANGNYTEFFVTEEWGKYEEGKILIKEIDTDSRLYYLTNINDAIIKFADTGRNYFFLDNQVNVVGLITIGNLNCKHVYLYLYNLIIQLEHALGSFIYQKGLKDIELIKMFEDRTESVNAKGALERYKLDNDKGYDYNFMEYIFLCDLAYIIKNSGLIGMVGLEKTEFDKLISNVNEIRNVVAHPNKSLIKSPASIIKLSNALKGLDILLERISDTQHSVL
jgi:hypothetical protein